MQQDQQKSSPELSHKPLPPSALMAAVLEANKAKSRRQGDIPQFNLAEQIMSQQRTAAAVKRKAPSAKAVPASNSFNLIAKRISAISTEPRIPGQLDIIAEIVARDIKTLCERGQSLFQPKNAEKMN